jgi:hypothetical protein
MRIGCDARLGGRVRPFGRCGIENLGLVLVCGPIPLRDWQYAGVLRD